MCKMTIINRGIVIDKGVIIEIFIEKRALYLDILPIRRFQTSVLHIACTVSKVKPGVLVFEFFKMKICLEQVHCSI